MFRIQDIGMTNTLRYIFILSVIMFSCVTTQKVEDGKTAYELKQYAIAIDFLKEEYRETKSKGEIAFLLGDSYNKIQNFEEALAWFKKAVRHDNTPKHLRELAFAYKRNEDYNSAIATFEKLQRSLGSDRAISREINICRQASVWLQPERKNKVTIERSILSTEFSDYGINYFGEDKVVFTSDRNESVGNEKYKWTGNRFSDLYACFKTGGVPFAFEELFNTEHNEGTACFNQDFDEIYFTRCYSYSEGDDYCKIMYSSLDDEGNWEEPLPVNFTEEGFNYGHPTLIENDSVLVFTQQNRADVDNYDLYYSVLDNGAWSMPEAMPPSINTAGNEKFATSDGDTLYFSSDYLPGLGGLDIFKTYLRKGGTWAPPVNLKAPFNSGADDFGFVIDRDYSPRGRILERGYFCSSRNPQFGDDIFSFSVLVEEELEQIDTIPESDDKNYVVYLAIKVEDGESGVPLSDVKLNLSIADSNYVLLTDDNGLSIKEVDQDLEIPILASKKGYLNKTSVARTYDLDFSEENSTTVNVLVKLDPLITNREIRLNDIYYDFDRWDIRKDARPSLDNLAKMLKDNPRLRIRLASHTDCVGNDAYNLNLSQKRASSAVRYLIASGISPSRLTPQGYGESKPEINCICEECSDAERQENRRTTFTILE